jgi:hypothetical protein
MALEKRPPEDVQVPIGDADGEVAERVGRDVDAAGRKTVALHRREGAIVPDDLGDERLASAWGGRSRQATFPHTRACRGTLPGSPSRGIDQSVVERLERGPSLLRVDEMALDVTYFRSHRDSVEHEVP